MKKKLIIASVFLIVVGITIVLFPSNQIIEENIETVIVERKEFQKIYKTSGTICSNSHYYYYDGYFLSAEKHEGDFVNENETILKYRDEAIDSDDKTVELKSSVNGYIVSITSNEVIVSDYDFYISILVPINRFLQISNDMIATFYINEICYQARVVNKNSIGQNINGDVLYEIKLKSDFQGFMINQKINLSIATNVSEGLVIDKRAVYHDEKGYYLISSEIIDDINNIDKYRIDIEILDSNDDFDLISGIELEGKIVCVLSSQLKEIILDDGN